MIRINLLPFRAARKKENIRRQLSIFILTLIFTIIVMGWLQISWSSKLQRLKDNITQKEKELAEKEKAAQEVDAIEKELAMLRQKRETIEKLDKNRKAPVIILDAMSELVVPNRMWFKSFSDTGATVNITGIAFDNKTVADFMKRLEDSTHFSSVTLSYIREVIVGKRKLKDFVISCQKSELQTN